MRFSVNIKGLRNDFRNNDLFKETEYQVSYTSDLLGKTLSIGDLENNIQFTIPFDEILKMIAKGR